MIANVRAVTGRVTRCPFAELRMAKVCMVTPLIRTRNN